MKGFRFLTRLVLFLLLVGMATTFSENPSLNSVQDPPMNTLTEDFSSDSKADPGSIALSCMHLALGWFCASPAFAGDLEGDVQGD